MWLHRFADRVTRTQLRRALAARDYARGEVRRLEKRLRAEQQATHALRQITERWQSIARNALEQQGEKQ